jgi:hypothetical protein
MQKQLAAAEKLVTAASREQDVLKATNDLEKAKVESANRMFEIAEKYGELATDSLSQSERDTLLKAQGLEIQNERLDLEQQIADIQKSATASIDEEIARLQAVIAGKEEEYKWTKMIKDLEAKGVTDAAARVSQLQALTAEAEAVENLKSQYESLASGIAGEMTGAFRSIIDGSKSAEEAMSDMFKGIADQFLDMAMKILQDAITQQLLQLIPALFGGGSFGAAPTGFNGSAQGLLSVGSFADGGRPQVGEYSLVGERGPELVKFDSPGTVYSNPDSRAMMMDANSPSNGGGFSMAPIGIDITTTSIAGVEYLTVEQGHQLAKQAADQGAKRGEAAALGKMRNSPGTRSRLKI